ncbi:hypothetical protein PUNSTDRAFT_132939 [Punctularia strigosozonata HHB-11173 SS5]|uniref:uncharacterized protein n=1 Tax=Punctularia strigosozonata (strain HHB-11173) TaxID=741275 RepID=UPI0004417DAC|nr:uncharacterized protein PUNSTDRAFT_132939 [Punctularia strigosozonata HHB-11173 SS5]EIN10877.1 hypothetical protein PUNSTDRAFT_132939 [Punctularia strigosozonata HHB-11173 SS5]
MSRRSSTLSAFQIPFHLGFQIGSLIFFFVNLFTESKAKVIAECQERNNGGNDAACKDVANDTAITKGKVALVVIELIPLLVQLYAVLVVLSFQKQLQEEKEDSGVRTFSLRATTYDAPGPHSVGYKYDPPSDSRPSMEAMHPEVSYLYADAKHSYGNSNA